VAVTTLINIDVINRNPYIRNEAENYSDQQGSATENCSEGGSNVCDLQNGDWLKFKSVDFGTGAKSFQIRVASATSGGSMVLRLDGLAGTIVGTCNVQGTGGWQTWATRTCTVSGATGIHDLYLQLKGNGSGVLFNVNWWQFYPGVNSINKLDEISSLTIISKDNQKYLRGLLPNDVITIYNSLGQKINTIKASSNEVLLTGSSGFVIIEVNRGANTSIFKTIL